MRNAIARLLDAPQTVRAAMAVTLGLGYFFIFVWAPHPWSWQGIDSYHELAKALARGEPFATTDVPWGYAYYAAFFYRLFGERIWVPLVVQSTINALVPLLLYRLVTPLAGRRVATLSAVIVALFSFNTIYASTQSSDALCTVLFLTGLIGLGRGVRHSDWRAFALAGACFGLVPQFRPNLVLLPGLLALAAMAVPPRTGRKAAQAAVFALIVVALQVPWIARNYRLTGLLLPTSTHGGIQLWYGTLQVGPFLESRAHNPRSHFASPALPYTSLWWRPLVIRSRPQDCSGPGSAARTRLIYWTDRDPARRAITSSAVASPGALTEYEIPAQANGSVVYYYFEQGGFAAPLAGASDPLVAFVSDAHVADLDRHGDVLDVFDIIRTLRHMAWQEALPWRDRLDLTGDGTVDANDLNAMVAAAMPGLTARFAPATPRIDAATDAVTLNFPDGSWLRVPRQFDGTQTGIDLSLDGEMAPTLLASSRTFTSIAHPPRRLQPGECLAASDVDFNAPFYLAETHMMQRYLALAAGNIRRDPAAFAFASAYRAVRLFVIRGTGDVATSQQFEGSRLVYAAGTLLSLGYLALCFAGIVAAYRRHRAMLLFLVPILYVPLSICFVLTNMRYTVTVQPLMFAFVAAFIVAALDLDDDRRA